MTIEQQHPAPSATAPPLKCDGGEWDCSLCLKLLYEPTTADCGHSFCRRCAYDLISKTTASSSSSTSSLLYTPHSNCPICRASLPSKWSLAPSIALERLLRVSFPTEYALREAEEREDPLPRRLLILANGRNNSGNSSSSNSKTLPLFVLDPMLPGQQLFLHVFEIRYRVLIQRALADHDGRFGMVGVAMQNDAQGNFGTADFGTEVEITNCRELSDGRFQVEILGKQAFRIIEKSMRDGYWEGIVEPLQLDADTTTDTATATATTAAEDTTTSNSSTAEDMNHTADEHIVDATNNDENENNNTITNNDNDDDDDIGITELIQIVSRQYDEWEECVRNNFWERQRSHMDDVTRRLGPRPTTTTDDDDFDTAPERAGHLALWIAAAINPLPPLGVAPEIRLDVLKAANHRQRLVIVKNALTESLKVVSTQRGTIQLFGITIYVQTLLLGVFVPILCLILQAHTRKVLAATGWDVALMAIFDSSSVGGQEADL